MGGEKPHDDLKGEALARFAELVESVGVKRFAQDLALSTRQVNRILSGVQPNPVERLIRCLQSGDVKVGDRVLDYVCQEMGGHFVRHEAIDDAAVNAVRECAEAIAAISDGHVDELDMPEIREAVNALLALVQSLHKEAGKIEEARKNEARRDEGTPPAPPTGGQGAAQDKPRREESR